MKKFELTKQHIALLRRMCVSWWDMYFGTPAIDPKRPYGGKDVLGDIAEILEIPAPDRDAYEEFPPEVEEKLIRLHEEMQTVLAIMLRCGTIAVGSYKEIEYGEWEKEDEHVQ